MSDKKNTEIAVNEGFAALVNRDVLNEAMADDCQGLEFSFDGVTGIGNPGGNCQNCPYNKFGSGEGQSKLCKNKRMLYMLREGELFPICRFAKKVLPKLKNNFPWPTPTDAQKRKIERTAQAILDARALYPDSSLADLYDEVAMPPELRKAHQDNDRAVMQAYGFSVKEMTESKCVAELMKMYKELTEKNNDI